MSMSTTTTLPQEITEDILSRLPVKSLSRFKSVCKAWHTLITDPDFVKNHLNRATTIAKNNVHTHQLLFGHTRDSYCIFNGYGSDKVMKLEFPFNNIYSIDSNTGRCQKPTALIQEEIGFCNGLLCFIRKDGAIILWNPSIRQYQVLPDPSTQFRMLSRFPVSWGFGFHPKTGEYKVIRIAPIYNNKRGYLSEVKVYTVGSGSWRELETIPYHLRDDSRCPQALVNGVLYWKQYILGTSNAFILSFDMEDEQFREVLQPDFGEGPVHIRNLGVLRGCLSMLVEREKVNYNLGFKTEIWVMEVNGLKESWMEKRTFNSIILGEIFRPWKLLDNGEILYRIGHGNRIRMFSSLEFEAAPRSFNNRGIRSDKISYISNYVESLVSPKLIEHKVEELGRKRDEKSTLSTTKHKRLKRTNR